LDDLQFRCYPVAAILNANHISREAAAGAQSLANATTPAADAAAAAADGMDPTGTPYLQSGRLAPPLTETVLDDTGEYGTSGQPPPQHQRLNKTTLTRMNVVLERLKVPMHIRASPFPSQPPIQGTLPTKRGPLPTKRCCVLYDSVRNVALTLLILQKVSCKKKAGFKANV
jgi:hypothetical protein